MADLCWPETWHRINTGGDWVNVLSECPECFALVRLGSEDKHVQAVHKELTS